MHSLQDFQTICDVHRENPLTLSQFSGLCTWRIFCAKNQKNESDLERGDAGLGARHLEVHLAEEVLEAEDVEQHGVLSRRRGRSWRGEIHVQGARYF